MEAARDPAAAVIARPVLALRPQRAQQLGEEVDGLMDGLIRSKTARAQVQHCRVIHLQLRDTMPCLHLCMLAAGGQSFSRICLDVLVLPESCQADQMQVQGGSTWQSPVQVPAAADSRLPRV